MVYHTVNHSGLKYGHSLKGLSNVKYSSSKTSLPMELDFDAVKSTSDGGQVYQYITEVRRTGRSNIQIRSSYIRMFKHQLSTMLSCMLLQALLLLQAHSSASSLSRRCEQDEELANAE